MTPHEIEEFRHALVVAKVTEAVQEIWLSWMTVGGASATGLAISRILFRRHAGRSGPKTNIVQRQGAARNDYEDDPCVTVETLMERYDLKPNQVLDAIAKVGVSGAIYRAMEEDRVLRSIFGRSIFDAPRKETLRTIPKRKSSLRRKVKSPTLGDNDERNARS